MKNFVETTSASHANNSSPIVSFAIWKLEEKLTKEKVLQTIETIKGKKRFKRRIQEVEESAEKCCNIRQKKQTAGNVQSYVYTQTTGIFF